MGASRETHDAWPCAPYRPRPTILKEVPTGLAGLRARVKVGRKDRMFEWSGDTDEKVSFGHRDGKFAFTRRLRDQRSHGW